MIDQVAAGIKDHCGHINIESMTCGKVEAGEFVEENSCLNCLAALYRLGGKQNKRLCLAYIASQSYLYLLLPR